MFLPPALPHTVRMPAPANAPSPPGPLCEAALRRRFDKTAATFDRADFVHRHVAQGMLARMAPMTLQPRQILDAGAATGAGSRALAKRFRRSRIVSLDASLNMLRRARRSRSRFARVAEVQADARRLPLAEGCIDVVFANLLLPWLGDHETFFAEVARVLAPGGLFVFSSLGPDSLAALRAAWREVDADEHVQRFADMHDVGDAVLRAGLRDPVLDVDFLELSYRSADTLFVDLTSAGARNSLRGRRRSLTGKNRLEAVKKALAAPLALRLELVFGHAWGAGPRPAAGEVTIDARSIRRRELR